ncbi:MAG: SMP-30/gluconolactonase/LRE family protein [Alphaproteobacteria bacterium]|nr:SMP-30/gluconolactonase/LRE family protein [Alphaproteobacteria bacterium]
MTAYSWRRFSDLRCRLGEGPVWDDRGQALFLVDIEGGTVNRLAYPDGARTVWDFDGQVCGLGLCESGRLIVAERSRVILLDPESDRRTVLADIAEDIGAEALAHVRLNDSKVGPDGAFYAGTMDESPEKQPVARLYRFAPDGSVQVVADDFVVSNGLAWSPNGATLYHADSRGPWVNAYRFEPLSGALGAQRRFVDLDEETGRPDGAAMDQEGCYWSAGVSSGHLNRFSPTGVLLEHIPLPLRAPTMPCFGGPDGSLLFLTGLQPRAGYSKAADAKAPPAPVAEVLDGHIIMTETETRGAPAWRFDDSAFPR